MFFVADNLRLNEVERVLQDFLLNIWILDDAFCHCFHELRHDLSANHQTPCILINHCIYEGVKVCQERWAGLICEEVVKDGDVGRALVPLR